MDSAPTALLVGKIMDILENEAYSIAAVRDEVDEIKQELVSMTSFLEDVDGKKTQTEAQKAWVTSVRDLTSDVEDIIDEFMYHMYEQQSRGRFARWLHRTIHIPKNLFYRRKIANKLHKITKMIKAIPERNKRYALDGVVGTSWDDISKWVKNQAVSSLFINEDELVGIDGKKQTLTAWLLNEEQHLTVVSVVGMGGSGKTTLVAKTFTNETINRHFDSYAWITVSQTYVIEDLFRSLIKELHQTRNEGVPPDAMDLCDSIQKLKLLQYLALGVSGEEEFLDINALSSPPPHLRRLIFASKLQKVPPWFSSLQNLTFLYLHWTRLDGDLEELPCLGRLLLVNAYVGNELCFNRGFPKLTILELFNFPLLNKITIAEGVMTNLQLLTLGSCMELKALPQGFEYLSKLETLELLSVSMQLIESIQEGGVDHPKICYYFWSTSSKAPSNVCKLKKLQVLACVESEGNIVRLVGNMTQLTRIGITNVKERDETDLRVSIQKMKLLSYLSLIVSDEEEFLRINALPSPSPHLQNLTLAGKLELVPPWFCLLSLTFMNLHWSRLEEDLLPHIQGLPSLRSLILFNAYTGKELYFSSGFVNLVHLQLCNFPLLKKITIEQGVMKNLQFLMLDSCMELQTLPSGIEHLSNLETLQLGSVSLKLIESIQEGGVDRAKVQHLPDIDDLVRTLFGRFHESNAKS